STNRRIKRYIIKKTHKWLFAGEPVKRERFQEYVKPAKQPKSETKQSAPTTTTAKPPDTAPQPKEKPKSLFALISKKAKKGAEVPKMGKPYNFSGYDWRVLDIQNDQALLLSELILEKHPYNETDTDTTWENCTLRKYLNNDFYNKLSDKGKIAQRTIPNKDNQWFGTSGGIGTTDKIFLFSLEEMVQHFGDGGQLKNRLSNNPLWISDKFNKERIAKDTNNAIAWWWLRSPGRSSELATNVGRGGSVSVDGRYVSAVGGVRPALWLNL
ncbi:MAG: DUF6273 domain-containing protein, partial [Turicibacter sp.]|nr:DUF6273 domain-containing protein [Turicibacter sp.]